MAVFSINPTEMELERQSLHPGVTLCALRKQMRWDPRLANTVGTTLPATERELEIVRNHALVA